MSQASQPLRTLTEEELRQYHEDGVVMLKQALAPNWMSMVEAGVDPASVLDAAVLAEWQAAGAEVLHLGMRGQTGNGKTPFAEIMDNNLVLKAPQGWLAVVRPDRVVMHDGPSQLASTIVKESLHVLGI